jgi:hypothetical protein
MSPYGGLRCANPPYEFQPKSHCSTLLNDLHSNICAWTTRSQSTARDAGLTSGTGRGECSPAIPGSVRVAKSLSSLKNM